MRTRVLNYEWRYVYDTNVRTYEANLSDMVDAAVPRAGRLRFVLSAYTPTQTHIIYTYYIYSTQHKPGYPDPPHYHSHTHTHTHRKRKRAFESEWGRRVAEGCGVHDCKIAWGGAVSIVVGASDEL